jgi:hypothetical protein
MFLWLLNTLETILGSCLRTIFTDEDSTLVAATYKYREEWRPDFGHGICIFHKRRNFKSMLTE